MDCVAIHPEIIYFIFLFFYFIFIFIFSNIPLCFAFLQFIIEVSDSIIDERFLESWKEIRKVGKLCTCLYSNWYSGF